MLLQPTEIGNFSTNDESNAWNFNLKITCPSEKFLSRLGQYKWWSRKPGTTKISGLLYSLENFPLPTLDHSNQRTFQKNSDLTLLKMGQCVGAFFLITMYSGSKLLQFQSKLL